MTRLLFWIALVILVVAAVRSKLRAAIVRAQGPAAGPAPSSGGAEAMARGRVEDKSEAMLCCARCGIYFPSSEAVRAGGRDYCSPAHAQQEAA